ncbi:MAG: thioredoxin [Candidatus Melainabacteria bacterium]|nr:thioredoxin [Candidatus Melainabacteria bacterium]
MVQIQELSDDSFSNEVLSSSDALVVVDFWAPWCGPCRALAPLVEELAKEYAGKVKVCKINTDDNIKTALEYRINSIPSLLVFKAGQPVDQMVGVHQKSALVSMLDKHLNESLN